MLWPLWLCRCVAVSLCRCGITVYTKILREQTLQKIRFLHRGLISGELNESSSILGLRLVDIHEKIGRVLGSARRQTTFISLDGLC